MLVLLDNCEHLLDAAADLVDQLLARCPVVRILATSREALDVPGEQVIRLRSLALPDSGGGAGRTRASRCHQAFRGASRSRRLTHCASNRPTRRPIAEICRRLDGIPLAIELAAARVVALSPSEIAGHLDERFRLLTGGRRASLNAITPFGAAVDWSYSLLERHRAAGLRPSRGVSVDVRRRRSHRGGRRRASRPGTSSTRCPAWWPSRCSSPTGHRSGSTRYQMLETLRQYARERLDTADADACRGGTPGTTPISPAWPWRASKEETSISGCSGWRPRSTTCGPRCCGASTRPS